MKSTKKVQKKEDLKTEFEKGNIRTQEGGYREGCSPACRGEGWQREREAACQKRERRRLTGAGDRPQGVRRAYGCATEAARTDADAADSADAILS